jgi:arylsulfatase A-like enzyme
VLLVAFATVSAACAPSAPVQPIVRALDHLQGARYSPGEQAVERVTLLDLDTVPADGWWAVTWSEGGPTGEQLDSFEERALITGDGELLLTSFGAWLHVIDCEPGQAVALQGRVLAQRTDTVRLGLVEFNRRPRREELLGVSVFDLAVGLAWASALPPDGREPTHLLTHTTGDETRALGVVVGHAAREEGSAVGVHVTDLELYRPGVRDHAAALALRRQLAPDLPAGRFTLGRVVRPALALSPGASLALDVPATRGPATLQLQLGLLPGTEAVPGPRATLVVELRPAGASDAKPLARWTFEKGLLDVGRSRWSRVTRPLPLSARGRPLELRFSVEAEDGARCVAAFADPRIVPARSARPGPNLLLVSLDTLRADRVGHRDGERPGLTPCLDAFAVTATVFEDVWAQASYTLPSHMSLFSGQYASTHGVQRRGDRLDRGRTRLLAELMRAGGYTTAAFTGGGYVHPELGFARGFDRYGIVDPLYNLESPLFHGLVERLPSLSMGLALEQDLRAVEGWLGRHRDEPFFLFVHTYATHGYDPPRRFLAELELPTRTLGEDDEANAAVHATEASSDEVGARLTELYDATVRQADEAVGRLLDALDRLGLADDTVVVITSDHGEELGEHGRIGHGRTLYEEVLQVPLLVRVPGWQPARVETPVMLIDVLPTLLDELGLPSPEGLASAGLFEADADRPLFSEVDDEVQLAAMRLGGAKLVASPAEETGQRFELSSDPGEQSPQSATDQQLRQLLGFRAQLRVEADQAATRRPISDELRTALEELGYTGDG